MVKNVVRGELQSFLKHSEDKQGWTAKSDPKKERSVSREAVIDRSLLKKNG